MKQLFGFIIVVLFFWISGCESTTNSSQQKQDTTKVDVQPDSTLVEELPDSGKVLDAFSGNVWRRINFTSPLIGYFWPSPGGPTTPLLKTTDGGFSWRPLSYTGLLYVLRFYNDNIGLIATQNQTIWRTHNGGISWETFAAPFPANTWMQDIYFDPANASRVWMISLQVMYTSVDTGRTWTVASVADSGFSYGRQILFTSSLTGWLLSDIKIYKTNNSSDWIGIQSPPEVGSGNYLDGIAGGVTVAALSNKIYKTIDGTSWQKILDGHTCTMISVQDNTHFWIGDDYGKIYNTTDGGITWIKQYSNSTKTHFFQYIKFFNLSNGIAMGAPLWDSLNHPITPTLFLYTTNGGTTWTQRIPKLKN